MYMCCAVPLRNRFETSTSKGTRSTASRMMKKTKLWSGIPLRKIRNIFLEDDSMQKVKICLWMTTNSDIRTGDHVQVTDVVINCYKNETSMNSTYTTRVTKLEQPTTRSKITVMGASIQGDNAELLLEDDTVRVVPSVMIQDALPGGT